jgi:class 3 adenylate cyclase/tetratricopeptide (TPR) repeat protein
MAQSERSSDTERRHATVLFGDITGFTTLSESLDAEEVFAIITGCLKRIDAVARRHGGSVDKYLGDAIMATFGIPQAMEEASKAAVNAAIEMLQEVQSYNEEQGLTQPLDIHIGINSGLLISGDVSGPVVREFAVMGDTVNVASRLTDNAPPGSVFVGSETYRETCDDFEYRELEQLTLKGKQASVRAFDLLSREQCIERRPIRADSSLYAPFIEREDELTVLEDLVAATTAGRGNIATVVGEAGIGKSRLVIELMSSRRCTGVTFLKGQSIAQGQRLSHHPFADLLRDWSDSRLLTSDEASAALTTSIESLFGERALEIVPFVLTLAGLPVSRPYADRLHGLEGEALTKLVLRATKQLLRELAKRQPLVLIFEDVHWADTSSVRLLEQLLGLIKQSALLFVLVGRPGYEESAEHLLEEARTRHTNRHHQIALEPFSEYASHRLIEHFFSGSDAPGTLRARIVERSGGNPLYLEEVIRGLIDSGALAERKGALTLGKGEETITIPETIREVVMTRFDRLDLRQQRLLQQLSVVGRRIPSALVEKLAEERSSLSADLAHLADLVLLVEEPGGHLFRHALIREIAYESILKAERPRLHQRAAEAIEQTSAPGERGVAAVLAHHFGLAEANESAEHYLFLAGEEAIRSAVSDEALQFFQEAADRYHQRHGDGGDPKKRAALEKNIALAYHFRGDLEASQHFTRALELLGEGSRDTRAGDEIRFAATLARVVRTLYRGRVPRHRPSASESQREVIALMTYRAEAQTTGDPRRFLLDTMETHRVLNQVDPRSVRGGGGLVAGLVGVFSFGGMSFPLGERTLRLADQLVDPDDVAEQIMLGFMRYTHHFLAGDWDPRHHIDTALLTEGMRTGHFGRLWHVTNYLGLLAEQLAYRGDFAEAAARIENIAKISELYAYKLAHSTHQYTSATLCLQRGQLEAALDGFTGHYTRNREDSLNILALAERARIYALLGDLAEAQEDVRTAQAIVDRVGVFAPYLKTPLIVPYYLSNLARSRFLVDLTEVERALESAGRAQARAPARAAHDSGKHAERLAAAVSWRRPEIHCLQGTFAWLWGRPKIAVQRWERSLREAEALGMKPELARTHHEIARRLRSTASAPPVAGLDAASHERAAREAYEVLGIDFDPAG